MSLVGKIKFGIVTTVIMAGVIVLGGAYLHDLRTTPGPNEDIYTFHALFTPERRERPLAVTIDLNGVRYKSAKSWASPWDLMLILPKKSEVKLEVWQSEGQKLDCIIFRNRDGVVQSFPNHITGPGGCVTRARP